MSRLDEIRERLAHATPGPWVAKTGRYNDLHWGDCGDAAGIELVETGRGFFAVGFPPDDAEFIAQAPDDIAFLLGEIERLSPLPADRSE